MDGIVWNSRYLDPKDPDTKQLSPAASIRYAAMREGAHIISPAEEAAITMLATPR